MKKNTIKPHKILFSILSLFILSSCTIKSEPRLLVYKINNEYFPLEKKCVEHVSLRENRPIFYLNDNLIIELDNTKKCVQQFAEFISSNVGERIHTSFDGYDIIPATKIVSAMHFKIGFFSQAVTNREVALEIVKEYAN